MKTVEVILWLLLCYVILPSTHPYKISTYRSGFTSNVRRRHDAGNDWMQTSPSPYMHLFANLHKVTEEGVDLSEGTKKSKHVDVTKGWSESEFFEYDTQLIQALKIKRSYASIVLERLAQSIDDFQIMSNIKSKYKEMTNHYVFFEESKQVKKPRIVVLGTGWGSYSFLKSIDTLHYDVTVISPRNYFAFTPMLAASAIGTVEFRSICEPIRNVNALANYLEAKADDVDFERKTIKCMSTKCEKASYNSSVFIIPYDYLLISVGAAVNTFNIPGVEKYCQFLKQVEDAIQLRKSIARCFERANIPNLPVEEIKRALSFVIVGAAYWC